MMNSQIGRPKVDNPKDVEVTVRFDRQTNKYLLEYCEQKNITRAEAVRRGVDLLLSKE